MCSSHHLGQLFPWVLSFQKPPVDVRWPHHTLLILHFLKPKSGKVTRFFCQSPKLSLHSYSLSPAPPIASSEGNSPAGVSPPGCPSPCPFRHQEGYNYSPDTHVKAAVITVSKGENAVWVCKDVSIVETTGRGAFLPPGEASPLLRSLGMLVKSVGGNLGGGGMAL